jgi:hypothetical protein
MKEMCPCGSGFQPGYRRGKTPLSQKKLCLRWKLGIGVGRDLHAFILDFI